MSLCARRLTLRRSTLSKYGTLYDCRLLASRFQAITLTRLISFSVTYFSANSDDFVVAPRRLENEQSVNMATNEPISTPLSYASMPAAGTQAKSPLLSSAPAPPALAQPNFSFKPNTVKSPFRFATPPMLDPKNMAPKIKDGLYHFDMDAKLPADFKFNFGDDDDGDDMSL